MIRNRLSALLLVACLPATVAGGPARPRPDALVDLRTETGLGLVRGTWRYADASIVPVDGRGPGPDLRASGPPVRTWDVLPRAGVAAFDDSAWEVVPPSELERRRGPGRLSFGWYRLSLTLPERIAGVDVAGSTVVFEIVLDDYAEVWVDGRHPRVLGRRGGPAIAGFNAANRVVVARDAQPGRRIGIAVFAANGPLSEPPSNFIWVRSATLELYDPARAPEAPTQAGGSVLRLDPAIDRVVPRDAVVEKLAGGFSFLEGPVWVPDGSLLFSDPDDNVIYRYAPDDGVSVFRPNSGYTGADVARYRQPGSNGLALDPEGRLTICEHGNRRVTRLEPTGALTVLADRFEGKRLNSPNDLVYRSDGALFFTDPPFGLPGLHDDPQRELPFTGVFSLHRGVLRVVSRDLSGPNGLGFSPDERFLYVANWDTDAKVVMRYAVSADATLSDGEVFFDMGGAAGEEALDGLEVDELGNVFVSGPGGVWILDPSGRHLGTIRGPELPANFAWGDDDGRTLYLTARTGLYRIRLLVRDHAAGAAGTEVSRAR